MALEEAPTTEEYEPAGHGVQLDWLDAPLKEEKLPEGQAMHVEEDVAPTIVEK